MAGCINQTIGRQYAILAKASHPVVAGVIITVKIIQLYSAIGADEIIYSGLAAITAMVMTDRFDLLC